MRRRTKRKLKEFFKIFFLLLIIHAAIVAAELFLGDSGISDITSTLIAIISIPLSLVNKNLPFYTGEGILITAIYGGLNLMIQTVFVYGIKRVFKRLKNQESF